MEGMKYAKRVAGQVTELLNAGVPTKNITIVGASQGTAITIAISDMLANQELNYVLRGTGDSETAQLYKHKNIQQAHTCRVSACAIAST